MKSAITVCLVPEAHAGPFVFHDDLETAFRIASQLGFHGVEIFPPAPEALIVDDVLKLCEMYKLNVAAVGTGAGWLVKKLSLTSPDEDIREQATAFIEDMMTFAAGLNAPAIIGSIQGSYDGELVTRNQALAYLSTALSELGEQADALGQSLLYEPLNKNESNLFNRLSDTVDLVEAIENPCVRILCDLYHASLEEADMASAIKAAGSHIGHVHFADSNRQAVGFGKTDMAPIIQALRDIDYIGYLSAEVFPVPDSVSAAKQTIKAFNLYVT